MKNNQNLTLGWMALVVIFILASCSSNEDLQPTQDNSMVAEEEFNTNTVARVSTPAASVFGGGPIYKNRTVTIPELKASGFTEIIVWNIAVNGSGDLNLNYEFPIVSNGTYIGGSMYPNFANDMKSLKTGATSVNRVTFSVGSSNVGVFQSIRDLINAGGSNGGTGSGSILYRNFKALKDATGADAIDLDDENCYDLSSMVKFCVMLGNLGYNVALDPYTRVSFWRDVELQVNNQRPGTIDQVHLQCYAGGGGNNPCSGWNFRGVPVHPGLWSVDFTPSGVQSKIAGWKNSCGITGGWMWIYDDFDGTSRTAQYATAILNGLGGTTGVKFFKDANYGGGGTSIIPKGNYTLSQLQAFGFVNDWASSMQVPAGWKVILYQHDNFGGTSWTFTGNNPNFTTTSGLNDQASSCRIQ
jgi:hypothetical protein